MNGDRTMPSEADREPVSTAPTPAGGGEGAQALTRPSASNTNLPPGPRGRPLRLLRALRRDFLGFVQDLARTYGDVAYFRVGHMKAALLSHPEIIREVLTSSSPTLVKGRPLDVARALLGDGLLTTEGDVHRRQRQATQPAFRPERVQAYGEAAIDETISRCARWEDGVTLDVAREMSDLAAAIASRTMFSRTIDPGVAAGISRALDDAMHTYTPATLPYSRLMLRFPLPSSFRFRRARAHLRRFIADVIREHRDAPGRFDDLIGMLLRAHDDGGEDVATADLRVQDEALTMLLAAFETTSRALAWAWYALSEHPDVEVQLHAEVDRVLGGHRASAADDRRLSFTRSVFAESLRLYPPVYAVPRETLARMDIGEYVVPARTLLLMCPFAVQRDERFFPDPTRFDPGRWAPDRKASIAPFAFFPFGGGPRRCIGEAVAWNEAILVIATIAQRWRLGLVPGRRVEPELFIHMQPKGGLPMVARRRPDAGC